MQNSGDLTGPLGGSEIHQGVEYTLKAATDGSSVFKQVRNCLSRHLHKLLLKLVTHTF